MILRWADAGVSEHGEPLYKPADKPTRLTAAERLSVAGPYTRAEALDAGRSDDRHAWPMPMGCGDEPATEPSEVACNRCNVGRRLGVHPCPRCGCPEYRMLVQI